MESFCDFGIIEYMSNNFKITNLQCGSRLIFTKLFRKKLKNFHKLALEVFRYKYGCYHCSSILYSQSPVYLKCCMWFPTYRRFKMFFLLLHFRTKISHGALRIWSLTLQKQEGKFLIFYSLETIFYIYIGFVFIVLLIALLEKNREL